MSVPEIDKYKRLNDIDISKIELISDSGGKLEIKDLCKHISIYEDMFSPTGFMSGYIYISDATNLKSHFPITGHETLHIVYRTPGMDAEYSDLRFDVYSMTDRTKSTNERTEMYRLNFVSKNHRINSQQRISKKYKGPISNIVKLIIQDCFPEDTKYLIEPTKEEVDVVIPNLKPVEAIKWLASMCKSKKEDNNPSYVFFESFDRLNFLSMGTMSRSPAGRQYSMTPTGVREDDIKDIFKQFLNVQDFAVSREFNRSEEFDAGMYSSRLYTHDITTKEWGIKVFNYMAGFLKDDHLEDNPMIPAASKYIASANGPSFFRPKQKFGNCEPLVISSSDSDEGEGLGGGSSSTEWEGKLEEGDEFIPNQYRPEEFMLQRKSSIGSYNNRVMKIRVAGDSRLRIGMVAGIKIPSNEPMDSTTDKWYDKYVSGRHLVSRVRHTIDVVSGGDYTCMVELASDSNAEQYPDKKTFSGEGSNGKEGAVDDADGAWDWTGTDTNIGATNL